MANSLILTIKTDTEIILVKDIKTQEAAIGGNKYNVVLNNISFMKKIYEPGVIMANIQFKISAGTTWNTIGKDKLDSTFKNRKVELAYGEATKGTDGNWTFSNKSIVCSNYYIHELNPSYKSDSLFVTMIIYSVDKQLALIKSCQSWVSQRLCIDIVETNKGNFNLPYDSNKKVEYDYSNLKHLAVDKDYKETIFPYLVQYDESYYDFLVRTCNRWGEFLYFENGNLTFGYDDKKKTTVDSYSSYNFCNLNGMSTTPVSASTLGYGATYDQQMINNNLKKGKYDAVKGVVGCNKDDGGDMWGAKIVGNLFSSGKNLYDFVVDTGADELAARLQTVERVKNNNNNFNNSYFNVTDSTPKETLAHYDADKAVYNEFSEYEPHLTSDLYQTVVEGELDAAQDAVCINFDTAYKDLKLGEIITLDSQQYIVIQVNTNEKKDFVIDFDRKTTKTVCTTTFQVIAIKQASDKKSFYPTMHPAGHIRLSGPQRAKIVKASTDDPSRQGRVRVQFPWQKDMTPWIDYAHPGGKGKGTFNRHYKREQVIVAFADNNVERPYVVGSLSTCGQTVPASTYINDIVHVTPGGQSIKMNDGTGAGLTAWFANVSPSWKIVQGFYPGQSLLNPSEEEVDAAEDNPDDKSKKLSDVKEKNKCFEGSIELTDKYGMYSIKGSTDGRNVSIKSPFGDIKLSAFTGITISAPNGDVKIAGKNVTIEAGNNLTLTSGKNIKDGFWCSYQEKDFGKLQNWGLTIGAAIAKKLASMVGGFLDMSIIRYTLETFIRPIEGKLQVKSNRYLALEAGSGQTAYPVDAFNKSSYNRWGISYLRSKSGKNEQTNQDNLIRRQFDSVNQTANDIVSSFVMAYSNAQVINASLRVKIEDYTKVVNDNRIIPCKPLNTLIDDVWANPDTEVNENFMGFQGMLADAASADNLTDEMIKFFVNDYTGNESEEDKAAKKNSALERHLAARQDMVETLTSIKQFIKRLKTFTLVGKVGAFDDDAAKNALGNDELIRNTLFKNIANDADYKHFVTLLHGENENKLKRQLRRKFYLTLINTYHFVRTATGGVAGIGGSVPQAPDPFDDNIEAQWNTYVNSIQTMPKITINKGWKMNFTQNNFIDPLLKQNGMLDMINDFRDCEAFGANSKGKILFSSGQGTMTLENDIMRANVDNAEDTDYNGGTEGFVSKIRNQMKA